MIDTHAHIYLKEFDDDRTSVIERAKAAGVKHIILPNVDTETIQAMLALRNSDPLFFSAAIGLHPTAVTENYQSALNEIEQQLNTNQYCAIGEIGIDLYWDKTHLKEQKIVFEKQLEWAIKYQLPVIIHVRDAFPEALESVQKLNCKALKGVFHSFTGTHENAKEIAALGGFKLGINGVVTFKNAGLAKTLLGIPLNNLVLETDAPYLTPVPHRGKRNEPKHLIYTVKKLAEIYQTSSEDIIKKTDKHAKQVFETIIFATD